jgi:hypothetical protein
MKKLHPKNVDIKINSSVLVVEGIPESRTGWRPGRW